MVARTGGPGDGDGGRLGDGPISPWSRGSGEALQRHLWSAGWRAFLSSCDVKLAGSSGRASEGLVLGGRGAVAAL